MPVITDKPVLLILCGLPGSGKSYFAQHIARSLPAVWLSGDGLRGALFEDRKQIKLEQPNLYYKYVFGALDYAATQVLGAGFSVIYETQGNTEFARRHMWGLAESMGALPILVLVQVDHAVSRTRASQRQENGHEIWVDPAKYDAVVNKFEPIEFTDDYLVIDGTVDQKAQFGKLIDYINR